MMDPIQALIIAAWIIGGAIALAALLLVVYGGAFMSAHLRRRFLDAQRESLASERAKTAEGARVREASDKAKTEELTARRRIIEAEGDLARMTMARDTEMAVLKRDADAKAKGILSALDARMREQVEQAKRVEARMAADLAESHRETKGLRERVDELRTQVERGLARERDLQSKAASLEATNTSLMEQIADLRAHLSAMEAKAPLDRTLMELARQIDEIGRRIPAGKG